MEPAPTITRISNEQPVERDTIVRAHTCSIVAHAGIDQTGLWRLLHTQWDAVQRAANATLQAWFIGDDAQRLSVFDPKISSFAYGVAREAAPELRSGAVADICQRVRAKYLADRWASRVSMRQSGMSFRRPLPLSIRRQDWNFLRLDEDDAERTQYGAQFAIGELMRDERPIVRFVIRTARDAALLERVASGEWPHKTLEILPPGWDRKGMIRAKIVYERPVTKRGKPTGALSLHTATDALLVANDGDAVWHWNYDWLRERIIAYEARRYRHAEDCKHERRVPKSRRQVWREDAGRAADTHHNRVRTALANIAHQAAGLAARRNCAKIVYGDNERGWCDPFPWHMLREKLEQQCQARGLELEIVKVEENVTE